MSDAKPSTRTRVEETINADSVTTRDEVERVTEFVTVAQARACGAQVSVSVGPPRDLALSAMGPRTIDLTPEAARAFAAQITAAADVADSVGEV